MLIFRSVTGRIWCIMSNRAIRRTIIKIMPNQCVTIRIITIMLKMLSHKAFIWILDMQAESYVYTLRKEAGASDLGFKPLKISSLIFKTQKFFKPCIARLKFYVTHLAPLNFKPTRREWGLKVWANKNFSIFKTF